MTKKAIFCLIEFLYELRTKVNLGGFQTFFHVKQSDFQNNKWLLGYTQKCMKEAKTGFGRNATIPKLIQIFSSQFDKTILKQVTTLCLNFEFVSFELTDKYRVKKRYGRDGPGRFFTDIDLMVKQKLFYSINHIKSINSFRDVALFESPMWMRKEALLLSLSEINK